MKRFIKKRWFGIPVVLLVAILVVVLAAGGVVAAYTAWTGTVQVGVGEAVRVVPNPGWLTSDLNDTVVWTGQSVTVTGLVAGEWATFGMDVFNDSTAALTLTITMTKTGGITTWVTGVQSDLNNMIVGGPAPAYSWVLLQESKVAVTTGNPIVFTLAGYPVGGPSFNTKVNIFVQAGTDIAPSSYTFRIDIDR